jgi:serine/threonine protein phosphatase PrpC
VDSGSLFARLRDARRNATPPDVLAEELVELALANGTRDNATAVVVRCLAAARKESIWKKDILAWMKRKDKR